MRAGIDMTSAATTVDCAVLSPTRVRARLRGQIVATAATTPSAIAIRYAMAGFEVNHQIGAMTTLHAGK